MIFFCKLCAPTHALNHLFPPTRNRASLRTRGHSYQLPEYSTDLHKKSFLIHYIALSSEIVFIVFLVLLLCTVFCVCCLMCVLRLSHLINITYIHETGMGDRLQAGIPSRAVTSQLGQLSLASLRGRLIKYQLWLG